MKGPGFGIRSETAGDRDGVRAVHESAFGRAGEADLVDALREAGVLVVSLLAEVGGRVVGHIAFSPVTIDGHPTTAVGLAPLAVSPDVRGRGAGSMLMRDGLARCRAAGIGAVVVLGDPAYYGRFGFGPADSFGLRCEYDVPDGAFQAIELERGALADLAGLMRYRPEFAAVS